MRVWPRDPCYPFFTKNDRQEEDDHDREERSSVRKKKFELAVRSTFLAAQPKARLVRPGAQSFAIRIDPILSTPGIPPLTTSAPHVLTNFVQPDAPPNWFPSSCGQSTFSPILQQSPTIHPATNRTATKFTSQHPTSPALEHTSPHCLHVRQEPNLSCCGMRTPAFVMP